MEIARLEVFDEAILGHLRRESLAAGLNFLDRLLREYASGSNRFDQPGEAFWAAFAGDSQERVAVGTAGLNVDPFAGDLGVGRLRRLYVAQAWRGRGIGVALTRTVIEAARPRFSCLQLRSTDEARGLYESLGFLPVEGDPHATHRLVFRSVR